MNSRPGTKAPIDALMKMDKAARDRAGPWRRTRPVRILAWLSEIGDQPQMITLSAALLAAGLAGPDRRLARAGVRMLVAHGAATWAKDLVKARVDRSRPRSARGKDGHRPAPGRSESKEETSFPSGHSAGALAVARAFSREFPRAGTASLGAAGLVAAAQVPRCAHYPTDVGAGIAIGLAAEAATGALLDRLFPLVGEPATG